MAHEPTWRADPELPHPALKAILLCERAIQEAGSHSVTLVGILDHITVPEFPTEYARGLALYVRVIDAAGEYPIRLDLVRPQDDQIIGEGNSATAIPDRQTAHELIFDLPRISFDLPGRYDFRVFANDRFIGSEVLLVEEAE